MSAAKQPTIIYTLTDEAPLLATYAFLPVIRAFADAAGIDVKTSDISVAARILAEFGDYLTEEQRVPDNLAELGEMTQLPDTNIIKLPNISASVPQLLAAIKELKAKGYDLPDYPGEPKTDEEREIKRALRARCLGSAVNPVLREGNSDRRAPKAVKEYARKHPHSMGKWSQASRTHVATMKTGDFYHGEKTMTLDKARTVRMELVTKSGQTIVLKPEVKLDEGDVIDSMFMSKKALCEFYEEQMEDAYKTGVMFSLHVKATMMKVSHPIVFGHAVKVFYKDAFAKHQKLFDELDVNVNNGLSDLYAKIESLPASQHEEIIRDLHACHEHRPELAMVDSAKGISNFHSPSDVIVDASMPAMIRLGGKMYGADGRTKDTKAVNPESTFSRIYQEIINFCKTHGQFDPTTMGTVPNVGLMAQQAEEYGSHDKTFEIPEDGVANIVDVDTGEVLLTQNVEEGDIWRMPVVKDAPIRDWVKLAVTRARESGMPVVFWLDQERPHENELRKKVNTYLADHDTEGLDISIMSAGTGHAAHDRARDARAGHHCRDGKHPARLPDRPVPDPRAGHQRQDAVHRAADGRRRPVRNRRRRFGAQARQSAGRGEPPAVGLARRIPGAGRQLGGPGHQDRQREGQGPRQDARRRDRKAVGQQQESVAQDRRTRQPWQPVLPRHVLGRGARRAERRQGTGRALRAAGQDAGRQRGRHRGRTQRGAGRRGGDRWLLLPG